LEIFIFVLLTYCRVAESKVRILIWFGIQLQGFCLSYLQTEVHRIN